MENIRLRLFCAKDINRVSELINKTIAWGMKLLKKIIYRLKTEKSFIFMKWLRIFNLR